MAERRRAAMRLYWAGRPMREVVALLKQRGYERTSPATACRDVHAVLGGYKRLAARAATDHVADQLQRLAHLGAEIERDPERSRGEFVETASTRRATAAGPQDQATVKKRSKYGDPRPLALLAGCWDRRRKLLGLLKDADPAGPPAVKLVAGVDPQELV